MPQSLHVLATHIVFSTKERRPWLKPNVRPRAWAYMATVLRNLECDRVIVGGAEDHVHILCNLTKKHAPVKVMEVLKKDSSKFVKTLDEKVSAFHWQDGYGLFSVSPSHWQAVEKYFESRGTSPQRDVPGRVAAHFGQIRREVRRTLFVGLMLSGLPFQGETLCRRRSEGVALG
jgi:REP element-mobilizing transposase RayT